MSDTKKPCMKCYHKIDNKEKNNCQTMLWIIIKVVFDHTQNEQMIAYKKDKKTVY